MSVDLARAVFTLVVFSIVLIFIVVIGIILEKANGGKGKHNFIYWFLNIMLSVLLTVVFTKVFSTVWTVFENWFVSIVAVTPNPVEDRITGQGDMNSRSDDSYVASPSPTTNADETPIVTAAPVASPEFEDYVSDYAYGMIKYSSPEYGIDVLLPDGYVCESYCPFSQEYQMEEIELQYQDLALEIDITIVKDSYIGFDSLEFYYEYYYNIYKERPNLFKSLKLDADKPYCVFSFNTNNGEGIYYELIYISNGV